MAILLATALLLQQPLTDPAATGRPVHVSGGVMAGRIVSRSLSAGLCDGQPNGMMTVHVTIGRDGRPISADPVSRPLENTARLAKAILDWRYRPYEVNGKAVEVETTISADVQCGGAASPLPR